MAEKKTAEKDEQAAAVEAPQTDADTLTAEQVAAAESAAAAEAAMRTTWRDEAQPKLTKADRERGYYTKVWNGMTVYQCIDDPFDSPSEQAVIDHLAQSARFRARQAAPAGQIPILDRFGNVVAYQEG